MNFCTFIHLASGCLNQGGEYFPQPRGRFVPESPESHQVQAVSTKTHQRWDPDVVTWPWFWTSYVDRDDVYSSASASFIQRFVWDSAVLLPCASGPPCFMAELHSSVWLCHNLSLVDIGLFLGFGITNKSVRVLVAISAPFHCHLVIFYTRC